LARNGRYSQWPPEAFAIMFLASIIAKKLPFGIYFLLRTPLSNIASGYLKNRFKISQENKFALTYKLNQLIVDETLAQYRLT